MHDQAFIELGIVIMTTLVICSVFKWLKQPVMIGYIISGIVLSPNLLDVLGHQNGNFTTYSQIGISFLLFMVGLGLNPKNIKDVGKPAIITGVGQVLFTTVFALLLGTVFGLPPLYALYLAIGLSFSSIIIIMKLLSDKNALETLYGRISVGFLIVQDLIAMLILMFVSASATKNDLATTILELVIKGAILGIFLYLASTRLLPWIGNKMAKSQEMLLLFSITWCIALASLFSLLGFSLEIGALLAGITLSISPYKHEISAKMKPLRDFFIMIFFVMLGSQMILGDISRHLPLILTASALVLIGNPLIVLFIMGRLGYTRKTSFMAGLTVAQISEFSLILATLGIKVGHVPQEIIPILTMIALITMGGSTYFIMYSEKIFKRLSPGLHIFEKTGPKVDQHKHFDRQEHDIVLIGYAKMGIPLVETFRNLDSNFFVIDYDPQIIQSLKKKNFDCLYADISNLDTFDEINLSATKMVISTIKDADTNLMLINTVKSINKKTIIIVLSHQIDESLRLYEQGADYVIMPFHIGGHQTSSLIAEYGFDLEKFLLEKNRHVSKLLIRKELSNS